MIEAEVDFTPLSDNPADHEGTLLLPVGNQLDAAFKAVEFARGHLDAFDLILRGAPREREAVLDCLRAAALHIRDAHDAYVAALEISNCRGQA